MTVTSQVWLLLMFRLPARSASLRVQVWRHLRRSGALPLHTSGYLLPDTPANRERFEWLAAQVRRARGAASVVLAQSVDNLPGESLAQRFREARGADYAALLREVSKVARAGKEVPPATITRFRRRLREIAEIDFFGSPARSRVEAAIEQAAASGLRTEGTTAMTTNKKDYQNRIWITRPRPKIDRVSSAWLIRRFIDPKAKFVFAADPAKHPRAVPFDMYQPGGFGHRGEDCTFETLCKEFRIKDARVQTIAQIVHDADLDDEKFARQEGFGLLRVLEGWAQQGVPDRELLRRGMELIEGLYKGLA